MSAQQIKFSSVPEFSEVVFSEKKELLCMASLKAPEIVENEADKRAPIDLIAVIDRSGSMAGQKLNLTKDALSFVIDQLDSRDSFAVVSYDTNVNTDISLQVMNSENKKNAKALIKALKAGSSTNLSGGLEAGINIAAKRTQPNDVCSILLFTDGLANSGVQDIPGITQITDESLKKCKEGCTVFGFGFGADHDPAMLQSIATAGKGLYYYIESVDKIPLSFADCIGGLQSVVAQNIKVTIKATHEAAIQSLLSKGFKTVGNLPATSGSSFEISLGDLYSEEERDVLFNFELPALSGPTTEFEFCDFTLEYFNVLEAASCTLTAKAVVSRPDSLSGVQERNKEVDKQYNRIVTVDALEQSRKLADQGKFTEAKNLLNHTKGLFLSSVSNQESYTGQLQSEMDEALDGMASMSVYESSGKMKMYSKQMSHEQQRSSEASSKVGMYENKSKMSKKKAYFGE